MENSKLKSILCKLDIMLTEEQANQFQQYYELLIEWNNVMNLTAITEYEEVIWKHFYDSLSIIKIIDINDINSVIDIGTGAGFPGIPLKIIFPHLRITLLDSLNKRINFLNEVIDRLGLSNIEALHTRAEDLAQKNDYREKFDLCVSRAVANLTTLSEICIPFIKNGGCFISYKSGKVEEEILDAKKAIHILGATIIDKYDFEMEYDQIFRSFVKISKISATPKKYPRKAGIPNKEPLK